MAHFREQIEETKALLSSQSKTLAYAKLLRLQEILAVDSSAVETLVESSRAILASVVLDISDTDEEIAAQALKCLGFMIYHPNIVASIGGDDADVIIESLVQVITTTKTKSVCNLGVWCVSIQQFGSSLLARHFQSLLRAVNHALENPIGSVSVTFEAMQAVVKLASSLTEQMRNMSVVWIPPIYRRLVSVHKRDRDMSERCLLKVMHLICPPPRTLSKALAVDMKKKLIWAMNELLDQGMKIQSLRAWGWFIRLLGPYAIKDKHLVNEMLKMLQQTFSESDSQVKIASLVAWEGLIGALIEPGVQLLGPSEVNTTQSEADRHLKRIKLIMAPLIGIMSSKCDVSVHASCMSTWSYLLHKLGESVSCESVINIVWEPIIKAVFQVGLDNKNILLWNFSLDLFDNLILGRNQSPISNMSNQETNHLSLKSTIDDHLACGKCPLRHYVIRCAPWNLCQLNFFLRMIFILRNQQSNITVIPEFIRLANDGALRLFGSLMNTVQRTLQCNSIAYDEVMQCLNAIFGFLVKMCKNMTSEDDSIYYCPHTCLEFLKLVTEILGPSILESPLYKVDLVTKTETLECATEIRCATIPGICHMEDLEDSVLPVVHLSVLYFYVVNSSLHTSGYESLLQKMQGYLEFLLSSYNPLEVLHAFICLLYKNTVFHSIQLWIVIVNCLQECINASKESVLQIEADNVGYSLVLHLLSYPFASGPFSQTKLELQVIEAWNLLYVSVDQALQPVRCPGKSFSEDLCALLIGCVNQITSSVDTKAVLQQKERNYFGRFVLLCGDAIICVLKQLTWSMSSKQGLYNDCVDRKSGSVNSIALTSRFMKLFWANKEIREPSHLSTASRFLSELVKFIGCLHQKEDILVIVESTAISLLEWLSEMHLLDENTNCKLQSLWSEILKGLRRSEPSLEFNSSFLEFQQPLLERVLDHPNPGISKATINFWNSTYGAQHELEFPKKLLPMLDKLYRNGKIKICSRNYQIEDNSSSGLHRYNVTTMLRKCSKRVEILGNPVSGSHDHDGMNLGSKRKRSELTERQKEVRRAQQGRTRDCNRHGPGIWTYTNVDFSQVNEESQDNPDSRDADSISEMLRKVC